MMDNTAKAHAESDLNIVEATGLYFESTALLIQFYEMRDRRVADPQARRRNAEEQISVAERFLTLCRADSRIGFEASVGYMYLPLDIREKIAVCRYLLSEQRHDE